MEISRQRLIADHEQMVRFIEERVHVNDFERALSGIQYLATFAYSLPYLDTFSDNKLEHLLKEIADNVVNTPSNIAPQKSRVVFIDSFGWDARGFTQQYLHALWDLGYDILFIRTNNSALNLSERLLEEIKNHTRTELLLIDDNSTPTQRLQAIAAAVTTYEPFRIFMHLAPWDVAAVAALTRFPNIVKYQIDFTDHAFWLGTSITDQLFTFRDWGTGIAQRRGIPLEKITEIPAYPIIDKTIPFNGFPIETSEKIVGFSGGSVYKIKDKQNTFLVNMAKLLKQNPDFVFLFAQIGPDDFIREFIDENNLHDRFILLGNRKDIFAVFQNIDLYINTFPYGGGNMILYAAAAGKPILALSDPKLLHTHLAHIINCKEGHPFSFFNTEDFIVGGTQLINDSDLRKNYGEALSTSITDKEEFTQNLRTIIENPRFQKKTVNLKFDQEYLFQTHMEFEKFDKKKYYQHLRSFYGLKGIAFCRPTALLPALFYTIKK